MLLKQYIQKTKSQSGYDFIKWANELITNYKNNTCTDFSLYEANNYELVTFVGADVTLDIRVSPAEDTVWVNKDQLCSLYDTTRQNIEYHIDNIYFQNELDERATCKEILQVQIIVKKKKTYSFSSFSLSLFNSSFLTLKTNNFLPI